MKKILCLAKKDFFCLLYSPVAAFLLCGFFLLAVYFFLNFLGNFNISVKLAASGKYLGAEGLNLNQWVIENYYTTLLVLSIIILPLIVVKSYAEEQKQGSLANLLTYPVSNFQLAFGKFLGLASFVTLMFILALCPVYILLFVGNPESLPLILGSCFLILAVLSLLSLVMGLSSFFQNVLTASFVSFLVLILLFCLQVGSENFSAEWALFLVSFSPLHQAREVINGVLSLSTVTYFVSLFIFGLYLSMQGIRTQRV